MGIKNLFTKEKKEVDEATKAKRKKIIKVVLLSLGVTATVIGLGGAVYYANKNKRWSYDEAKELAKIGLDASWEASLDMKHPFDRDTHICCDRDHKEKFNKQRYDFYNEWKEDMATGEVLIIAKSSKDVEEPYCMSLEYNPPFADAFYDYIDERISECEKENGLE